MTKSLPPKPSVKFLKLEAKSILKAHKQGNISCCEILRHLHQFKEKSNQEILDSQTSLQEVQFALAVEYGFKTWNELKEYVSSAKGEVTEIKNLTMKPFNTSLIGVIRGVADYFSLPVSDAMLYGLSGHAFLININEGICPSSPYVWDMSRFRLLLENIGINQTNLGFYSDQSNQEERRKVESSLRKAIDAGMVCSMCNKDNQIISGYDEQGLLAIQPWGNCVDCTPAKLSYGSWREFKGEIHVNFYKYEHVTPVDRMTAILDSLDYALELNVTPSRFNMKGYGIGSAAYDNWINAAEKYGSSHGNWWNATVWSECRSMAAKYFAEIGKEYSEVSKPASDLGNLYTEIAKNLKNLSSKEMSSVDKISLLKETKKKEATAIKMIKSFRVSLQKIFTEQK